MRLPVTVANRTEMRDTHEVNGVLCREGTYDEFVAREIAPTYGWMQVGGRRVLDIGGNIGAYARWAIDHQASAVWTIEPEESNFTCLAANTRSVPQTCEVRSTRALVATTDGIGEIWLSPTGKNPGNTSSVRYRGRVSQGAIPQLEYQRIVRDFRPDVVKIDVEGAEYEFWPLGTTMPPSVRQVTMEIHLSRPAWREADGPAIAASFSDWDCVRQPKFEGGHWQTIGAWQR